MKADGFLRRLGQLGDQTGVMDHVRGMVLQLAIRGRLVPQDTSELPAAETIEQICELQKATEGRSSPKVAPVVDAEADVELPTGWTWVRLSQLGDHRLGKMLDKGKNKGKLWPYLRNTNVQWNRFDLSNVKAMRFTDDEIDEFRLLPGDLMVCEGGHPGRCAVWQSSDPPMMFQKAIHRLRPTCGINPHFLRFRLQADVRSGRLQPYFTGATIQHLTGRQFRSYPIPLPPVAEQSRIVAKVDELMALCDELERQQTQRRAVRVRLNDAALNRLTTAENDTDFQTAWTRIRTHFDTLYTTPDTVRALRQAILQLAIQGKLVEESADVPLLSLGDILAEHSLNGYGQKPNNSPPGTPILRISAGTSRQDGIVDEGDHRYAELTDDETEKYSLRAGDLLACRFNGNLHYVGRVSLYTGYSASEQVYPDKLIRFRVDRDIAIPEYVRYAMNACQTRETIERMCATTAGNIGISATKLKTVRIPVPSVDVQENLVAQVDQMMDLCDELEANLTQQQTDADRLAEAMVAAVLDVAQA